MAFDGDQSGREKRAAVPEAALKVRNLKLNADNSELAYAAA